MEHDAVLQVAIYQLRFDELDSAGEVIPTCTTDDAALPDDRYDPIAGLPEHGADQALGQAPCGVLQADFVHQRWNDEMIPLGPQPSAHRPGHDWRLQPKQFMASRVELSDGADLVLAFDLGRLTSGP